MDPGSATDRLEETEADAQASRSSRAAGRKTAITQNDVARGVALLALDLILEMLFLDWLSEEDGDPISVLKNHILTGILAGFRRDSVCFSADFRERENAFVFRPIFGSQAPSVFDAVRELLGRASVEHKNGGRRALQEFFQKREIRPVR